MQNGNVHHALLEQVETDNYVQFQNKRNSWYHRQEYQNEQQSANPPTISKTHLETPHRNPTYKYKYGDENLENVN